MIWQEFSHSSLALIEAAEAARASLAQRCTIPPSPSRGPAPTTIDVTRVPRREAAFVYVARLLGFRTEQGKILLKVGFSGDPRRRSAELNAAFPTIVPLRWRMIRQWQMQDLMQAYRCEQAILTWAERRQFSCGGEFLLIAETDVQICEGYCQQVVGKARSVTDSPTNVGKSEVVRRQRPRRSKAAGRSTGKKKVKRIRRAGRRVELPSQR
ncbi:GIY-YIG nuclease family protein [Sphingobium lignivorans]|uniref:Bacteriophage T5 Orf172 DNA-binding domain-containing protein n=1 Tax=Sphingobium lignivorans TaxID=2735886 RepID=A0ABR6NKT0_9SPHN|nr:GIY-YIG nuclease family protein [Sphingobium lignivorans]MBB5987875.1 hypothetical protein [Sphingobium lignivorans]